jgi:alpha-galactosidase
MASHTERQRVRIVEGQAAIERGFDVTLTPPPPGAVDLWTLTLASRGGTPTEVSPVMVEWFEPLIDGAAVWTTAAGRNKGLPPEWGPASAVVSKATAQAPVACLVSGDGRSRVCIACSDALYETRLEVGVLEETAELRCRVTFFLPPHGRRDRVEVQIRIDRRDQRYERALGDVASWWESLPGYAATPVPEAARLPMYSTWYNFHQTLDPARVEAECALSRELGCGAVIVDDGWQTLDAKRGYAFTGDWAPDRIPDMAGHVARIHALGMKFILWYSVPFVGRESRAFARFRDKLLYIHEPLAAGVLDPRFPDVREFIIDTYERAMREWKLDGFKLDFVDRFKIVGKETPAAVSQLREDVPGRDYDSPEAAVDRLLADVVTRLRAIDPDVLIEFRQTYVGPLMRKYGNMFRAADCPADHVRNRLSTIDVRLLCGSTACHADMIMWNKEEPAAAAALQLLAVMFSVPQISMFIAELPADHRAMLKFWLGFWCAHRETLIDGELRAESPELNYPVVTATSAKETVIAAYARMVLAVPPASRGRPVHVINATRESGVVLDLPFSLDRATVATFDATGTVVSEAARALPAGLHRLEVPPAGLLTIA